MPYIFLLSIIAFWRPEATADGAIHFCDQQLNEIRPTFDPDLRIQVDQPTVTYRGVTFRVAPIEGELLKFLILAPREVIAYDDLIAGLWGMSEPENPMINVSVFISRLRKRFRRADSGFDKIKICRNKGVYWARDDHQKIMLRRLGVARYIYEGYVDGTVIPLEPSEHAILSAALARTRVYASSANIDNLGTFKTVACTLNRKLALILGLKPLVRGPHGSGSYELNQILRGP